MFGEVNIRGFVKLSLSELGRLHAIPGRKRLYLTAQAEPDEAPLPNPNPTQQKKRPSFLSRLFKSKPPDLESAVSFVADEAHFGDFSHFGQLQHFMHFIIRRIGIGLEVKFRHRVHRLAALQIIKQL